MPESAPWQSTVAPATCSTVSFVRETLLEHLSALHELYGESAGVRIARKHLKWYAQDRPENSAFRAVVNRAETAHDQLRLTRAYFDALEETGSAGELSAAA